MLQLLLHADENGITEFSDRGIAKATEIPYQQVRTIHQHWLADGIISNAVSNAAINANHVLVNICDYESYNPFNIISNAVSNAVTNALKDKETTTEKDKVFPENPLPTEKEKKKEKDDEEKASALKKKFGFVKPTVEEVAALIAEKGYHFDAEMFINFYESNGWMVGKNKMKNWKAACNTWEQRRKNDYPSLFSQQDQVPEESKKIEWE